MARAPSVETIVSNPRTARFDLMRSTMFGSSSTSRTRVRSVIGRCHDGRLPVGAGADTGPRDVDAPGRPASRSFQPEAPAVRGHDRAGDRQAEAGAGCR